MADAADRRGARVTATWAVVLACWAGPGLARAGEPDRADTEFFEKRVRPVLVERCGECHGTSAKIKGGLRLLTRAGVLKGGDSGPAAVPGRPEESLLVQVLKYVDEPRMPPSGKLSDAEIADLTRWVRLGLPWPDETKPTAATPASASSSDASGPALTAEQKRFWSFQPVRDVAPPPVKDAAWPRVDLDRFILAALEAKNLRPAPPADRRAWIRRVTYDLTGLPPTPEEVEAFATDGRPDAFERVVDRLLDSPRYGERWGRHWLDLVRYTDSFDARIAGSNNEMDINDSWRYRDWVVNALNRDLPYDRFITDQLAGDVVGAERPGGFDRDAVVATGMLAIGNWGGGDADKEKLLTDIADDQVDLVGRAFMGLTLACARCHDHKFDPISTRDYYGLAGIFFSSHILPNVGPKTNGPPMLRIPLESPDDVRRREEYARDLAATEKALAAARDQARAALAKQLAPETVAHVVGAWTYFADRSADPNRPTLASYAASNGLKPFAVRQFAEALGLVGTRPTLDRSLRDVLGTPGLHAWRGEADTPSVLINTNPAEVGVLTFRVPAKGVTVHPGPASEVSVAWESPVRGRVTWSGRLADADPSGGDGVAWRLEHVRRGRARVLATGDLNNGAAGDLTPPADQTAQVQVEPGDLVRLAVLPKGSHTCDTTLVRFRLQSESPGQAWDLADDLLVEPLKANPHADRQGHEGVWRLEHGERKAGGPAGARWQALARVVSDPAADRAAVEHAALAYQAGAPAIGPDHPFWLRSGSDESELSETSRAEVARLESRLAALRSQPPAPPAFANGALEGGVPGSPHAGVHDVKVHVRGSYARLGELVPRRFPAVLAGTSQPPITKGSGRRELAAWLTRPDHPLTARVMANRVWQHHFGAGVVRTPSNFGKLGEPPTHPDLLDHLALRLVRGGWSLKKLHREILLSSTYRQSTEADPVTFRADPDNRLFGRMNRRRLDAESVRDSLLAASGRLDLRTGGPADRSPTSRRRAVYLMTIRSDRSSFGALFDAADPTAMVDTRVVSTVAPQALYLLNNDFVLDQARGLSARLREEARDDGARIDRAYTLLYGRAPTDDERAVGRDCLAKFAGDGAAGPAAWDAYCHVLLCTNEWIYLD